uniref:Uncharacterized protein n=1 Tax=Acrobeloides nanus TaxID=290746 RepID=A0A914C4D3_9BILA
MKCSYFFRLEGFLPPYTRHGIFFFCGMELAWNAFIMAINQKFLDLATKILPVSYKMFDDTVAKNNKGFIWSDVELVQLNMYQTKLYCMWTVSTIIILYAMLCCVPQFCVTEDRNGKDITFCIKRPIVGYLMAPVLVILILMGIGVFLWQWLSCQSDYELFRSLFKKSVKEERFLSELEFRLNCIADEKELHRNGSSYWVSRIERSTISKFRNATVRLNGLYWVVDG